LRTGNDRRDDGELVRRARGGDRDAFTALVGRYRDMVYGAAYCFLGNAEDAQDAAQEAFVAAYRRLGQLREPEKFAPWLRRLTLNGCADSLRRRGARAVPWDEACQAAVMPDAAEGVTTRLAVREALGGLPEPMRLTVTLCYLGGYSHAEVARFLDIPLNTVRSRLGHAKRRLREEMRDMVEEEINEGKPDEQWTRRTVDEAMRRGADAADTYEKGEAVRHYDDALTAIATLPPGPERTRLTMDALWRKGKTDGFRSEEGLALMEQSLALAVEIGDRPGQMRKLMDLGSAFYNSGQEGKTEDCFGRARALAQELGDTRSEARCLTSLGLGRLWGDRAQGAALFAQALPLYEQAGDLNGATYCRAMLDVADKLGPENLRVDFSPEKGFWQPILGFYAGCDTFQGEGGVVSHVGETCYVGYTWPDELTRSPLQISRVFWQSSQGRKILDASVPVGGAWSGPAFSFSDQPLKATVKVLSDTETVSVPAGTFAGCLLTEQVTTEDGPANDMNRELCGTVRAWYAPGVGLVQLHVRHEDGLEATLQLQAYQVGEGSRDFLPLAVGNRWEYGWADVPAEYDAREVYQVAAEQGGLWYVEHFAYAYRRDAGTAPTPGASRRPLPTPIKPSQAGEGLGKDGKGPQQGRSQGRTTRRSNRPPASPPAWGWKRTVMASLPRVRAGGRG